MDTSRSYCIIAGEASGDAQAALLVSALTELMPQIRFFGVTGPKLRSLNVESIGFVEDLAVMGMPEILPRYFEIARIYKQTRAEIEKRKPDVVIFVDYPGFNLRLLQDIYFLGMTTIYHIPPKVWSHGLKRIEILKKFSYLTTCILPFEEAFFKKHRASAQFIGNPLNDAARLFDRSAFQGKRDQNMIGLFPGSRENELKKLLPLFISSFVKLQETKKSLKAYIPLAPTLSQEFIIQLVHEIMENQQLDSQWMEQNVIFSFGNANEIMAKASYGWVCSGTATLEAAFFGMPFSLIYKASPLLYFIGRLFLTIKYIGLVNLCLDCIAVPEFIQHEANESNLVSHALEMIENEEKKLAMLSKFNELQFMFPPNAATNAAIQIINHVEKYRLPTEEKFHMHRRNAL